MSASPPIATVSHQNVIRRSGPHADIPLGANDLGLDVETPYQKIRRGGWRRIATRADPGKTTAYITSSYFSGLVATTLGRASRRSLQAATAFGGAISINGRNSRNGA